MTPRDRERLHGVHPALVEAVEDILDEMAQWGHPMFVVEGIRTETRQQELYAQGRTTGGPIVTHADGITSKSNHQIRADGYGHAVDCAFTAGNPYAQTHPWERYGEAAEKRGLVWGGRFTKIMDQPHVELPELPSGAKKA